ncbi:HET-domain-containing protein [Cenococcum geophilum 1.58]|uniref:HET-domain-containing protein n=1 Tax=Cenococcum geophilum 1.58 TaxID=794803 RepID=UPI00358FA555|nr:HET-domain-containing protein [Cenococcum geophilum 1.58]
MSSSATVESIYKPLPGRDYIRVLKLFPGMQRAEIKCELETIPSKGVATKYEAISYVWGDPKISVPIKCNGVQISITTNLADALRTFRYLTRPRTLWADALCINQQDLEEKNTQVNGMGELYKRARRVLVWAGRDPNSLAKDAFQLIRETNNYLDRMFLQNNRDVNKMPRLVHPYPISLDKRKWDKVVALFHLPWFERVWVVQEAALAKECDFHWGSKRIGVAHLFELVGWISWKYEFAMELFQLPAQFSSGTLSDMFIFMHATYGKEDGSWTKSLPLIRMDAERDRTELFVDVLKTGKYLKATNPRDHVYAFLGGPLAKDGDGRLIVDVDYNKSVNEVYRDIAYALLQHPREAPWLLSSIEHHNLDDLMRHDTPSWVPRWDGGHFYRYPIARPSYRYRAGGTRMGPPRKLSDSKWLKIPGFVFDKILWVSEVISQDKITLDPELLDNAIRTAGEPFIDMLWNGALAIAPLDEDYFILTLMLGLPLNDVLEGRIIGQTRKDFAAYRHRSRLAVANSDTQEQDMPPDGNADNFFESLLCREMQMIRTEGGRVGLGPGHVTRVNDVCCVLFGESVPYILTPVAGTTRYKLVGESYIHGVMDGELIEQLDLERFKNEVITLE